MALEFDINNAPPSPDDITAERERAQQERDLLRKKNIQFLVYMIIVVGSVLSFILLVAIPSIKAPDADQDYVFMFTYAMPYFIFVIFIVANNLHIKHVEKPAKVLDATLKGLQEVSGDEVEQAAASWQGHEVIALYKDKVAARGRSLVQAEIDTIQQWLEANVKDEQTGLDQV